MQDGRDIGFSEEWLAEDDQDVFWLTSRGERAALQRPRRARGVLGRTITAIGFGCLATAAASDTALAPVSVAHASLHVSLEPPAPAVIAIEPAPVFAPSPEEREQASVETGRQEVEEFLRFGQRELPKRLVETIVQAAITTEVDPIYLMALADKESSFRTEVKASTSSAEGLFQFIDRTWLEVVKSFGPKHGLAEEADAIEMADGKATVADPVVKSRVLDLRRDPYVAAVMAAELLKRDAALIGFKIGRKLTRTEMYIAHFLGLEDATRFIAMKARRKPASAVAAFPAAARANAAIFYAVDKRKRKPRGLSVPEVYARLDSMIEPRAARYRGVETVAGL